MTDPHLSPAAADLGERAVELARHWLDASRDAPVDPSAARLAGVLKDPDGLAFTVGFVDGVARPEDQGVAAKNLAQLAKRVPGFLPRHLRAAISAGGVVGEALPGVVVPIARRVLREMAGHLVIDARPAKFSAAMEKLRSEGTRLNINLLGEAVLGDKEAARRLEGTKRLLQRDDVDYVSVKVSSIASGLTMWGFDQSVERVAQLLLPLYRLAARKGPLGDLGDLGDPGDPGDPAADAGDAAAPAPAPASGTSPRRKFVNLDMEEYRDLDLTIAVFQRVLDEPELLDFEAGIVLQAYLPDALGALERLHTWAADRRARGGAPIKVRVVKGANLALEHVDAALHDWPLATYGTKQETDTNYKRVLEWALRPEHTDAVRIGVAGHNLFDLAWAWLLATERGVTEAVDVEMLLGMASAQADAVRETVGSLLLYTPVVEPAEFDAAIGYLVRRLEENASDANFMSSLFDLATDPQAFERERDRFLASLRALEPSDAGEPVPIPSPNRTQDRSRAELEPAGGGFSNAPDTDPSLPANRQWAERILARVPGSTLGVQTIADVEVTERATLDELIDTAVAAGEAWGARSAPDRAGYVRRAGYALEANRDRLIEVMASETGKTIDQGDPEVSEAIDFARYYAHCAVELDEVDGAVFVPSKLTVVVPPWNFPVAIPAGGVLAALAAGSAVIIKPAPQAKRSAAVMVEALWESGIPRDLLILIDVEEGELGQALIADPRVDRVILTGAYETAALFRSWRPDLPLLAETSGKNAIVVTPSADLDLAVSDIVKSAFGHAGQKCSAASLVILVGSVAHSKRFARQLVDAVRSLRVGLPDDPAVQMGPLIGPASGKLLEALTTLGSGERWLVEPRPLDETGRLWAPGLKEGVLPGSAFHLTEYFGPVLGILHATTLEQAIELQNAVPFGLTAGIHSLDPSEIERWLATVEAGNVYVNRGITGAIVRRQPFGGWKRSSVGASAKAGGPNHLVHLGSWHNEPGEQSDGLSLAGLDPRVAQLLDSATGGLEWSDFDVARRGAKSDQLAWETHFAAQDVSGLGVERNVLRYLPAHVVIRLSEGRPLHELLRVLAAATLARATVVVSSAVKLPRPLRALLKERRIRVVIEKDEAWLGRAPEYLGSGSSAGGRAQTGQATGGSTAGAGAGAGAGGSTGAAAAVGAVPRIRLIGGDASALAEALGGSPDIAVFAGEVTRAGRVELLPFLLEQSISATAHRFGNPSALLDDILPAPAVDVAAPEHPEPARVE
ncbi:bifunctional proline dehydrogenase/L-glutamate gamma-semialdehyde dehydrogenase [Herbiconiux sp.]|uniref:bifunctional proline dehydrogenase/L-glutamate gamma-semialdehyde dehydrogenase n=1 Tax=Herbiconiux sp. TaxID=1871186 RepID=UPI0025BB1A85|nr:bifunctional proline dehydrogenase/L-glutamate gamma-semialdehyde dehydrogenase [Herbiconiux sp.]